MLLNSAVFPPIVQTHYNDACKVYRLSQENSSFICDIHLITKVVLHWPVWETASDGVWLMAFEALISLVEPSHKHRLVNLRQLQDAGVVHLLLYLCLVSFITYIF